jgi:hypothetical protein
MKKESKPETYVETQKARQRVVSFLNSHIQSALGRYKFNLIPTGDAQSTQYLTTFESTGKNPQIILKPKSGHFPSRLNELAMQMKTPAGNSTNFTLYYDFGNGFHKQDSLDISFQNDRQAIKRINLPKNIKAIRLDPCDCPGEILMPKFEIRKISKFEILRDVIRSRNVHSLKDLLIMAKNGLRILRAQGLSGIKEKLNVKAEENYSTWIAMYDILDSAAIEKARLRSIIFN